MKKISTKTLASLGMLLALTIIMGMFFTFRPDIYNKIPTKFIPVAISGMLFGPVWGGIVGALADLISYSLNPTAGALLPQIILIEFLYGFSYGLILNKITTSKENCVKIFCLTLIQIIILHIFLTTYLLTPVYGMSFKALFMLRIPGFIANTLLQLTGVLFIVKSSKQIRKLSGGKR